MGGWEDYSKNKTNLSLRLVEVEAELGNKCGSMPTADIVGAVGKKGILLDLPPEVVMF